MGVTLKNNWETDHVESAQFICAALCQGTEPPPPNEMGDELLRRFGDLDERLQSTVLLAAVMLGQRVKINFKESYESN